MYITDQLAIPDSEIHITAIRAQGPGGQNVNKVSSAIHLRFDIRASTLPEVYKERLLALKEQRITREGVIVIKAQSGRSQEQNKEEALRRLQELLKSVTLVAKKRYATKPTRSSQMKRLDSKNTRSHVKAMRGKVID